MPLVTGVWTTLPQSDFDMLHPDGVTPLHFHGGPANYLNPVTNTLTGRTTREEILNQVATHGWPLIGIYISTSGQVARHFCVHRSQFPAQTGSAAQRAEKLQTAIDAAFELLYKSEQTITDPTDPDFGNVVTSRNFWANSHFFSFQNSGLFTPRVNGVGDYAFNVSNDSPPGNWWQDL